MMKNGIWKKSSPAWIILGVGILFAVFTSFQVKQRLENDAASKFAFECDQVTLKIQERLRAFELILRGGAALFAASDMVDRQEWRAFAETLQIQDSLPGLLGVGFSQVIRPEQLGDHIARVRDEGFPGYTVHPPGERALYTSTIYIEPFREHNLKTFGFDMFSDLVRRAAMEKARDTDAAALSGKVDLPLTGNDSEARSSTLMYVPVYRKGALKNTLEQRRAALIGWVFSPYHMSDLIKGILRPWERQEGKSIDLQIYDDLKNTPDALFFDSQTKHTPSLDSLFYQQRTIDFHGQRWQLVFDRSSPRAGIDYAPAWSVLIGGLVSSGLLFALLLSIINTRANAVRIADKATAEIRRREELLSESESRLSLILENVEVIIYLKDTDGHFLYANRPAREFLGASMGEIVGHGTERFLDGDIVEKLRNDDRQVLDHGKTVRVEETLTRPKAGGRSTYLSVKVPLRNQAGEIYALCGIATDITERKQAEEKLTLAASVFAHAREGIMITAADGSIIKVNDAFSRITGFRLDEVVGKNPRILGSGRHESSFYGSMWRELVENGHWHGEVWNRRKTGEVYAVMQTISAVRDVQGKITQYVALFSDITAIKAHQRQLEHIAHYDALTMLPNRVLLADRMRQAMIQMQRRGHSLAVAYLDLDGFKAINDKHGHQTGDQLLIAIATRMKDTLREGDTLARLGGDEFVALLLDLNDVANSEPVLTRLLSAAAQPFQVGDLALQVSASLGLTFYPQTDDVEADQLLRQADQAMYQAKQAGRNRYHVFDAEQDRSVRGHHESLERIRHALSEHEFVLHYQPKVNMRTGTVIGAEALIRWQHPERGLLPPSVFLPVIENHRLAVELGEWVIDESLTQMERWRKLGLNITVSVNVGARQLQQSDFAERLHELLAAHPSVRPGDLELEVLETSALEDLDRVAGVIESCRELGVMFALDDFGTGYSSLTYLKRLSVNALKIDQSFVRDMLDDPDDLAILGGVLGLAIAFRRLVIAEGVETVEHGEMLLQLGCELAQGYGIARPMPAAELPGWVFAWRPESVWSDLPSINRDDLPMLFASVEHRAWIVAVEAFIDGKRDVLPVVHHQCRFGTWLETEGQAQHLGHSAFRAIEILHREIHALAAELCELKASGRKPRAVARLGELRELRDALLEHLKTLVHDSGRKVRRR